MSQPGRTQIRTLANSVPAQARRLNATFHQPGGTVVRRHPVVSAALSAHMADARKRYVCAGNPVMALRGVEVGF